MIEQIFKKYRSIGVVGNCGEGKTSLILNELLEVKPKFNIPVYVLGVEESLFNLLESKGINILRSKEDILDLKIRDSIIYIDEFGDLFDSKTESRQLEKIKRFFNRIDHLNDFVIISTAKTGFYNKFIESLIKAYIVKTIDYSNLVNGTTLKRKIMGIVENTSDYRLDIPKNTYYIISEGLVEKKTFNYNKLVDSKKENVNPFIQIINSEKKNEKK